MPCWYCGTITSSAFCERCGKFANMQRLIRLLVAEDGEQENPIDFIDDLSSTRVSVPNDDILSFRRQLTSTLKGSKLSTRAQEEFIQQLVPVFKEGLAGAKLFADWLEYWKTSQNLVDKTPEIIEDIDDLSSPAVQELKAQLSTELSLVLDEITKGNQPAIRVKNCFFAASLMGLLVKTVTERVEAIKQYQSARTAAEVLEQWFPPEHMPLLLGDRAAAATYLKKLASVHKIAATALLHTNSAMAQAIQERLDAIATSVGALVGIKEHRFFMGDIGRYFEQKLADVPGLAPDIKLVAASGDQVLALLCSREMKRWTTELERVSEAAQNLADHHCPSDNSAEERANASAINVEDLVKRQQFLRQLSENKPGSALITAALGANWGAAIEAMGVKK